MKNLNFPGLPRALVVSVDDMIRGELRSLLQGEGIAVEVVDNVDTAVTRVSQRSFDLVFLDGFVTGDNLLTALQELRHGDNPADVLLLPMPGSAAEAVAAMRAGAAEVLTRPIEAGRLLPSLRRCLEVRQLRTDLGRAQDRIAELTATEMVGLSMAQRGLQTRINEVAAGPDTPVTIRGESGSGKEMVARALHDSSPRRHGPFVTVNCAGLSESQLEVELFGHEAGAFADRREGRVGVIDRAEGGTIYLDAITATSLAMQARLLRLLQDRSYRRVGGLEDHGCDLRVVVASTRDLRHEVDTGRFRQDLFHRLNVTTIEVPPLRERPEDVPLLAHFFLDRIGRQVGKALTGFTEEANETLCEYEWPGNVRELANVIEHAAIVCKGGMLDECHLPKFTGGLLDGSDLIERNTVVLQAGDCSIRALEEQLCRQVLEQTDWNISQAASQLGINRTTLYNKIRLFGLGTRPDRSSVS